jgi:UDPglucose 6-dehydrogenase
MGHQVVGLDSDEGKVETLRSGRSPFFEPGVQDLLDEGLENGRLSFTTDPAEAIPGAEVVFICVGTPPRASGEASLVAVEQAARTVARHATDRVVVAEKSTVPAGTHDRVRRAIRHERPDLSDGIEVVSNPEFLREGKAVQDTLEPERILVGAESETAREVMRRVYEPLTSAGVPLIETNIATAELAKHACNAFLSLKISYMNAIARMCEKAGADVTQVAHVMGTDSRIGPQFLNAGIGYGGFCFPKDIDAFERLAHSLGYGFPLLREVARINEEALEAAVTKVRDVLWNLEDKRIALFGLSFKPETDDVRFSPAIHLGRLLAAEGAEVVAYDPQAMEEAKTEWPEVKLADGPFEAARGAHCVVIGTEWDEFRNLDLDKLREVMKYPVIVDGRNIYDPEVVRERGFTYRPVGRMSDERTA